MPLTKQQCYRLLLADRKYDAAATAAAITAVLAENPAATLLDCEMALRDAAAWAFVVGLPNGQFDVVGGVLAMRGRLAALSMTPAENRERLAMVRAPVVASLIA
jgi:hypothetical protein